MSRPLGTIIVFDFCLPPKRGLSIRERLELGRGTVGCGKSDSSEEEEPLEIEGDVEERGGMSLGSDSFIEMVSCI